MLIVFVATCLYACQKEYSFEGGVLSNGPWAANFVLAGSPGPCLSYVINGDFTQGVAMTQQNYVQVLLNVNRTGPFNISTETIDGIIFSQSGTFTDTGRQQINLHGKGKPVQSGKFNFSPVAGASSCTFEINVRDSISPATYQIPVNSDGTCSSYAVPGAIYHGVPLTHTNMTITVDVFEPGEFTITTNSINGIIFSKTGKFLSKGIQKVQLVGSGTPKDIGVFIFSPFIFINGIKAGNGCNVTVYIF